MIQLRLELCQKLYPAWIPSSHWSVSPTPLPVSPGSNLLINRLHINPRLRVSFWRTWHKAIPNCECHITSKICRTNVIKRYILTRKVKQEQKSLLFSFEANEFHWYNTVTNSSWAAQSWSVRGIYQSGGNTTHHRVKSHSHTVSALLRTQLCITFLDVENVFGSRIQANCSPFLKTECGTYCVRDNGSSVWRSDYMFQRESLSAYHEKKKKNQTLYLLGKEKSSNLHSKKPALWVLSYYSWIKP